VTLPAALAALEAEVVACRRCPRLVAWREQVAREKRASFAGEEYWGRPVPGFGDPAARVLVLGLAPAAHGGNRTGRVFTGDRSGDWLLAAMHRAGFANQPTSVHRDDGLRLHGAWISAAVRCAPPANKPTPSERATCSAWLERDLALSAPRLRAILCLGAIGWDAALTAARGLGWDVPKPKPRFGHAAEVTLTTPEGRGIRLVGCYHVSPHNTFTGRLTPAMLDDVLLSLRAT
jgi:uracil-DNA glycosylase